VVNFQKSGSFLVNLNDGEKLDIADALGCSMQDFPSVHLGVLKCYGKPPANYWDSTSKHLEKKLALWQARYLSYGGGLVMLKGVLSHVTVHALTLHKCPASVAMKWERLQHRFLLLGGGGRMEGTSGAWLIGRKYAILRVKVVLEFVISGTLMGLFCIGDGGIFEMVMRLFGKK
jgi:hypothetical protein